MSRNKKHFLFVDYAIGFILVQINCDFPGFGCLTAGGNDPVSMVTNFYLNQPINDGVFFCYFACTILSHKDIYTSDIVTLR